MHHDDDATPRSRDTIPETIDNDWDRFYLEYPDVYDRFAISTPPVVAAAHELVDFAGKVVIDAGSGTGKSTFALAKHARLVIGLEPWEPMRAFAERKLRALGLPNVRFVDAAAPDLPFAAQSADALVSFWSFPWHFPTLGAEGRALGARYVAEAKRVLRPGGYVVANGYAPGWGAGELTALLLPELDAGGRNGDENMERLGFTYRDMEIETDYGSVAEAVATYGFIYGRTAIDYLVAHNKSSIRWRPRLYYQQV
jgi:SAM-dependent methyltransferase